FAPERATVAEPAADDAPRAAFIAGLDRAEEIALDARPRDPRRQLLFWAFVLALAASVVIALASDPSFATVKVLLGSWLLPALMAAMVLAGFARRIPVYDAFIAGAREGLEIAVRILPFMIAILVAVGLFRASGALDALTGLVAPVTSALGFPAEALPMA